MIRICVVQAKQLRTARAQGSAEKNVPGDDPVAVNTGKWMSDSVEK